MGFPCLNTTARKAPYLLTNIFGFKQRQNKSAIDKLKLRWISDNWVGFTEDKEQTGEAGDQRRTQHQHFIRKKLANKEQSWSFGECRPLMIGFILLWWEFILIDLNHMKNSPRRWRPTSSPSPRTPSNTESSLDSATVTLRISKWLRRSWVYHL